MRTPIQEPSPWGSDLELIRAAYAGDRGARRALFARLGPLVDRCARSAERSARGEQRRELAQALWLHLLERDWRLLRGFDPARGELSAWITQIARCWAHNVRRSLARSCRDRSTAQPPDQPDARPSAEQRLTARQELVALRGRVQRELGAVAWAALAWRAQGLEARQVAAVLGLEARQIDSFVHRARRCLCAAPSAPRMT